MDFNKFKFTGATPLKLSELPSDYDGGFSDKDLKKLRQKCWSQVAVLQEKLYAESKQSLLIVLQAMDAAGKDSSIAKITKNMNAQGCHVVSFKKPTKLESAHDFLWRVHSQAPGAGEITLFNRSHYEDVLVVKVHQWESSATINARYQHINNFEQLLADSGTKVVKIMLNISPEYQLERFKLRLDIPGKNWKFNPGDLDERKLWRDYMQAFEVAINNCSSEAAPWYVVPAENRRFRDVMIASIVLDALSQLDPDYPAPEFDTQQYTVDSI